MHYEEIGLIPPVKRNKYGVREYVENDLKWIEFIKCMRIAGIAIEVLIIKSIDMELTPWSKI